MMRKSPLAVRNSRWCPKGVSRESPTSDSSKAIRTRYLRQQCIELPLPKYAQIAEPKNLQDEPQKKPAEPQKPARQPRKAGAQAKERPGKPQKHPKPPTVPLRTPFRFQAASKLAPNGRNSLQASWRCEEFPNWHCKLTRVGTSDT